jgi:uncharacterized integral membrane protein (TIGR00697 family)
MIKNDKRRLKYLTLLAGSYVTIILLTMFVENRVIVFLSFNIVTGTLIIPLAYSLSDIITEVYGYNEMRRIMWASIFILYAVAIVLYVLMKFPSPPSSKGIDNAYKIVFHPFLRDVFTYSIAALAGIFLNSYLLSKWKILIRGKYFWMRSLGSSAIGEFIFVLTFGILAFYGVFPLKELIGILTFSYCYKIICNLLTIIPSSFVVLLLKYREGIDTYDNGIIFNPFKLDSTEEYVNQNKEKETA